MTVVTRVIAAVAVAALVASCGQAPGVHARFVEQFQQTVAENPVAHGQSARTRHVPKRRKIIIRHQTVPGGRRILIVPPPTPGPDGSLVITWPTWGALLLDKLGAPRCANNLIAVVAWTAQETTSAGWNPLATTYDEPGATLFNTAGVRNYATLEQGLDATVATLRSGFRSHGYGAIVEDLRVCADPITTAVAINASDWCRGCSGGGYVLRTVEAVIAAYEASLKR